MNRIPLEETAFQLGMIAVMALVVLISTSAEAETYYVASDGDDGRSSEQSQHEATPWRTLSHAESQIIEGDEVVARGGVYHEQLRISVPNVTFRAYPGELPIIDGEETLPPDTEWRQWDQLLLVGNGADGVVVDGFHVRDSMGQGIDVSEAEDVQILNCVVENTRGTGITVGTQANHILIEGCDVHHHNLGWRLGEYDIWGAGIGTSTGVNSDIVIRGCRVHEGYGEGIDCIRHTEFCVVEFCEVYDNRAVGIYIDLARDTVIRYNLVYGTGNSEFFRGSEAQGAAIVANSEVENVEYGLGAVIFGNIVAGTAGGIHIWPASSNGGFRNIRIYNNTVVEPLGRALSVAGNARDVVVQNNIFVRSGGEIASVPSDAVMGHNLWSQDPGDGARSPDDIIGDPMLAMSSGWSELAAGSLTGAEFALLPDSPAIDSGLDLEVDYDLVADCDSSDWTRHDIEQYDQSSQGTGWEIGADVFVVSAPDGDGDVDADADADADGDADSDVDDLLLVATRSRASLAIDGQLDEPAWSESGSITFSDPSGASDNTAVVRALWDDEALYFGFEIADGDLRTGGDDPWQDDGVELFLDPELDRGGSRQPDDIQVIVNAIGRTFFVHGENRVLPETVTFGVWTNGEEYGVELRLTWEELGQEPSTGLRMGLDVVNNDRDEDETRHPFDWANLDLFHFPDGWGVIELAGDANPPGDGGPDTFSDAEVGEDGDSDIALDGSTENQTGGCECSTIARGIAVDDATLMISLLGLVGLVTVRRHRG